MGQLCSCFRQNAQSIESNHIQDAEIGAQPKLEEEILSNITPQKEPLLNRNDLILNRNENSASTIQYYEDSVVSDESDATNQLNSQEDEEVETSLYQKIPSIPISVSEISNMESKISDDQIANLFEKYKDSKEDCILSDGIEQLCTDLQLKPDDFKILILAWKLEAKQMCMFTREEFSKGLKTLNADNVKCILIRLNELTNELQENSVMYRDLYRFAYGFSLDGSQRVLPSEVAIIMWQLVFTYKKPPILSRWISYLEKSDHVRGIPSDTWNMFLNFCEFINDDLSNYDDTEAWPSLFDDFVEYENDKVNQNVSEERKK